MNKHLTSIILALGIQNIQSSAATLTTYTIRAGFEAAIGGVPQVETFNGFTSEVTFHTAPLDVGPFTLSMTDSPNTALRRNRINLPPVAFPSLDVDGTNVAYAFTTDNQALVFTFDAPITAFGADFAAFNDSRLLTQVVVGTDVLNPPVTAGEAVRFFGFVSNTPFTTVRLRAINDNTVTDGYGIDNVTFGVPEPASAVLVLFGAAMISGRRKSLQRR